MSFNKKMIKQGIQNVPRKTIIHGPPKIGKSPLAGSVKNTLIIQTEDRLSHIDCDKTPVVGSMKNVYDVFDFLMEEKHDYKHLVIDTIDWLEPLLHQHICDENGYKSLTDDGNKETNFFKGLKFIAPAAWRKFLFQLDHIRLEKNIAITLVAHSAKFKADPPNMEPYTYDGPSINEYSLPMLIEWADTIAYYQHELFVSKDSGAKTGKVTSTNRRLLNLGGSNPAFVSCNSFGLADEIEVNFKDIGEIMKYILEGKGEN